MLRFGGVLFLISSLFASKVDMDKYYQMGEQFKQEFEQHAKPLSEESNKQITRDLGADYKGADTDESRYAENPDSMAEDAQQLTRSGNDEDPRSVGAFLRGVERGRQEQDYTLDLENDPLITNANDILANPDQRVGLSVTHNGSSERIINEDHECRESGDPIIYTGEQKWVVDVVGDSTTGRYKHTIIRGKAFRPSSGENPFNHGLPSFTNGVDYDYIIKDSSLVEGHWIHIDGFDKYWHEVIHIYDDIDRSNQSVYIFSFFNRSTEYHTFQKSVNLFTDDHVRPQLTLPVGFDIGKIIGLELNLRMSDVTDWSKVNRKYQKHRSEHSRLEINNYDLQGNISITIHSIPVHENGIYLDFTISTIGEPKFKRITFKDNTDHLERMVQLGQCTYGHIDLIEGAGTKDINGQQVHKDWWHRKLTYICKHPVINTCKQWRDRGCYQIESRCVRQFMDRCVEYSKIYRCQKKIIDAGGSALTGVNAGMIYCLDGNCSKKSYAPNEDFIKNIAWLKLLEALQKEETFDPKSLEAFKGSCKTCTRSRLGFQNCCGNSGWGADLKLSDECKPHEKELQDHQKEGMCIKVGEYCSSKCPFTGVCWVTTESYCCYGSKIAGLLHQQAGFDRGDPKRPNCRGFTIDELQNLDTSRIDWTPMFGDLMGKVRDIDVAKTAQDVGRDWTGTVQRVPTTREEGQLMANRVADGDGDQFDRHAIKGVILNSTKQTAVSNGKRINF